MKHLKNFDELNSKEKECNEALLARQTIKWSDKEIKILESLGFEYDKQLFCFKLLKNNDDLSEYYLVYKNSDENYKVSVKYDESRGRFTDEESLKMRGVEIYDLQTLNYVIEDEDHFFKFYGRRRG
jgi:hypothetical protein